MNDYFYTFDEVLDEMDYCGKREKENIEIIAPVPKNDAVWQACEA